ncbi:MAG TPA: winged helix-turn-helix domain-containing protein [Nevskiaceae bacterium]|nr:winged helix-turn-helix domain-containing protein [Nevskiaceae bacterium]
MGKRILPRLSEDAPRLGSRLWRIRDLELNERRMELRCAGRVLAVEPKPLAILMLLLRCSDRVLGPSEIGRQVWGGRAVTDSVVAQTVARLRRSLGPGHADLIVTVHGYGYRLASTPEAAPPPRQPAPPAEDGTSMAGPRRGWRLLDRLPASGYQRLLIEHHSRREQRHLLMLESEAAVDQARHERSRERIETRGRDLSADCVHALYWGLCPGTGSGRVEYPAGWLALPTYLDGDGGLARQSRRQRLLWLQRAARRVASLHQKGLVLGGVSAASLLVAEASGSAEPALRLFLPAALRQGICLAPRLYLDHWSGHESLSRAPEAGTTLPARPAEDVYALGILATQLLLGDWSALPVSGWQRDLDDAALGALIERATRRAPADRHVSVAQFLTELEEHPLLRSRVQSGRRISPDATGTA